MILTDVICPKCSSETGAYLIPWDDKFVFKGAVNCYTCGQITIWDGENIFKETDDDDSKTPEL